MSFFFLIFANNFVQRKDIMGFFGLFNKQKKETLDKGLEKTKQSMFDKLARAVAGKSKVDDDVLEFVVHNALKAFAFAESFKKFIRQFYTVTAFAFVRPLSSVGCCTVFMPVCVFKICNKVGILLFKYLC